LGTLVLLLFITFEQLCQLFGTIYGEWLIRVTTGVFPMCDFVVVLFPLQHLSCYLQHIFVILYTYWKSWWIWLILILHIQLDCIILYVCSSEWYLLMWKKLLPSQFRGHVPLLPATLEIKTLRLKMEIRVGHCKWFSTDNKYIIHTSAITNILFVH